MEDLKKLLLNLEDRIKNLEIENKKLKEESSTVLKINNVDSARYIIKLLRSNL